MVNLTVYGSAGEFDLSQYLAMTSVVARRTELGSDRFFTNTDAFGATAFSRNNGSAEWSGKLFLGGAVIGLDGTLGFAPEAMLSGTVGGRPVERYLAAIVDRGFSSDQIERRLLAGDDHLVGNAFGDDLRGWDGDDVIAAGFGQNGVEGGSGDDLILFGDGATSSYYYSRADGGAGDDVIVIGDRLGGEYQGGRGDDLIFVGDGRSNGSLDVYGDLSGGNYRAGRDMFYLSGASNVSIGRFDVHFDTFQLDPDVFSSLSGGIALSNINFGGVARDPDDFILIRVWDSSQGYFLYYVSYDADGSGPGAAVQIASVDGFGAPTIDNFVVGHLDRPTAAASAESAFAAGDQQALSPHAPFWPAEAGHQLA